MPNKRRVPAPTHCQPRRCARAATSVDRGEALARAHDVLRASGWGGKVRINGSEVVVTATGTRSPQLLGLLGVNRVHISQTGSADAISTPDG